jgi:glucose/arabinose dehydrogenase
MRHRFSKPAALVAVALLASACDQGASPSPAPGTGGWKEGEAPVAGAGLTVTALATGLIHPRALYPLPNGDILIVESTGPKVPVLRPRDLVARPVQADAPGGRITLIRPGDDGRAAHRTILLDNLTSPAGVALVGTDLYVANTDALMRYPYNSGDTRITAPGIRVIDLPAGPINRHWTRSLLASEDGKRLYIGVGANSNVGENGMALEQNRAAILVVDRATGAVRTYASGLRNPGAMQWQPETHALWVSVNERDGAGPVPDYLTSVTAGAFYGWPYSYHGAHPDPRAMPQRPDLVATASVPDYPLGGGVRVAGLAFNNPVSTMPARLRDGVFVAQQGSDDKVVFVPFIDGKPAGRPIDVVTGFRRDGHARGRPAGLIMDHRGALLVADDVGNTVWRISGPPLK